MFLEASQSFLGLGDPLLPTWGSILGEASNENAAFRGFWWWIAFPAGGIVFATVAFALLGYSFDKVLRYGFPRAESHPMSRRSRSAPFAMAA